MVNCTHRVFPEKGWRCVRIISKAMTDRLTYEEKKELPDAVFGLPERREYPMPDAAHVRAAEAYFRYCPDDLKPRLARAILQRAKQFGVEVKSAAVLDAAGESNS